MLDFPSLKALDNGNFIVGGKATCSRAYKRLNSAAARLGKVPHSQVHPSLGCLFAGSRLSRSTREEVYLKVVEAEVLMTTCHYCGRVLKQGCRSEESFQAEVTESKRYWPVTLVGWCYWETQVRHSPHKKKNIVERSRAAR